MQTHHILLSLALGGLLGLATGCGKKEEPPPTPAPPAKTEAGAAQKQVEAAVEAGKEAAQKAAAAATAAATQAVQTASQAGADASAQAQAIIDSAKKLIGENKWQEVAQTLTKLQGLKLTPDQEKTLADLKAQLEKLVQDAMSKQPALPGGLAPGK
jgi:predicted lipid-binding transport protein (Tim44 family)